MIHDPIKHAPERKSIVSAESRAETDYWDFRRWPGRVVVVQVLVKVREHLEVPLYGVSITVLVN